MRQVAGKLRLDLAQYRELAAFAQFGSELDKSALAQIARGQRMIELLKQDEHKPMPFDRQVAVIFAGTSGYLDDVPVADIRKFEENFLKFIESSHPEILQNIRDAKEISEDTKKALVDAIGQFKKERM
jgi:F-type H+-transporting ATPase subunit alpha